MNFLSIWMGNPPSNKLIENVKSNLKKLDIDGKYVFITDQKLNIRSQKIITIDLNGYLEKVFADFPWIENLYKTIPTDGYWHFMRSDIVRFHYMSQNENTLYMDFDIKLLKRISLDTPAFANKVNTVDYCLFYNDRELETMEEILKISLARIKTKSSYIFKRNWIYRTINKRFNFDKIDSKYFIHGV